jgi:hypothetical protein
VNIVKFPTKLPSPDELDLPRAKIVELLEAMSNRALARCNGAMVASNAAELAALIRGAADDAASDSEGWQEVLQTIRDSWGISA